MNNRKDYSIDVDGLTCKAGRMSGDYAIEWANYLTKRMLPGVLVEVRQWTDSDTAYVVWDNWSSRKA